MKPEEIKKILIQKMLSRRVINSHHIRWDTMINCGWKSHEKRLVKDALKECLREGLIIWAKKSHKAVTLNIEKIKEIKKYATGE